MSEATEHRPAGCDEPDRRLVLLHQNVSRFGTVFNTVAPGTALNGVLRRKTEAR